MRVFGIDFTSAPRRRKPLTCLNCTFDERVLRAGKPEDWSDFSGFEEMLQRPGPWIAGIDFPFGQSRKFTFEPVDGPVNNLVDDAYQAKYHGSPYLKPMIGARARSATVKVMPRESDA